MSTAAQRETSPQR